MKINLRKLFVIAVIGTGLFISQPAQAFYYDMSDSFNYTNNVINSTRNYLLSSEVISHIKKGDYSSKKKSNSKKTTERGSKNISEKNSGFFPAGSTFSRNTYK